jgi:tRNA modification GTPase
MAQSKPEMSPAPPHGDPVAAIGSSATATALTPHGRGAIATIRVCGDARLFDAHSLFRAANGYSVREQPVNRVCFGRWGDDPAEDVVLCRIDGSTTEVHCHGGEAAAARILRDLEPRNCRTLSASDWVRSAMCLVDAECLEALTRATTLRTAEFLLAQQAPLGQAASLPSACPSAGEAGSHGRGSCDGTHTAPKGLLRRTIEHLLDAPIGETRCRLEELLRWADFGQHMAQPWNVVLCGRPNVGKSSLINALLGYSRSIVYDQPGTTRDVVTAVTAFDGWPVELSDTAGIRAAAGVLESAGIERARRRLAEADLRIIVLDRSRALHDDDHGLLDQWPDAVVIANKSDLADQWGHECRRRTLPVSALTGAGLERLAEVIVQRVVPSTPAAGEAVPVSTRQAECLRRAHAAACRGDSESVGLWLEQALYGDSIGASNG